MDLRGARIPIPGATGEISRALAARAALATWLTAVHRSQRDRSVAVLEVNLPHTVTGFAARAVVGEPSSLSGGRPVREAVEALSSRARMIRPGAGAALEVVR